jgi:Fe-S-cluster containining protein|tara:strand:- start:3569 stop:3913 length:345 start_codon:yes stop_codon:yes gene_type:complete
MPLTKSEASRLARRTGMKLEQFTWSNNGVLTLLNNEKTKACVFLLTDSPNYDAEGICSVYDIRPKGCSKYPYVLDSSDNVIIDQGCVHKQKFPEPTEEDAMTLLNLEERLLRGE